MIEFKNVSKSFDAKTKVIDSLNFKINKGELVVLIGESGCGKTTTMKMINLLEKPTSGEILIDGESIKTHNIMTLRRNIGYVIQKVGLFPHMTVGENIELVPKLKSWDKEKKMLRAMELLEMVELDPEDYYYRYPNELSGGQQQRIGIARALAVNPDVILMDEPFSALDPITREKLQDEMLKLQEELKKTIVFVTHDMDEALKLADKIAVMKDGKIIQFDSPEEILKNPKNDFVEYFFGKDRMWKTPEMIIAKDIMKKKIVKISSEGTLSRSIEIMKEKDTSLVVVVDKIKEGSQEIIGVLTPKILRKSELKNHPGTLKVKDIMNKDFIAVYDNTNMVEVLSIMSEGDFRTIPVIDKENKVVGIITPTSLLNIINEISPNTETEEEKSE